MTFFIYDNVVHISFKVPLIRIVLSIGSLYGKNHVSECHPRFKLVFLFVNLQIKSTISVIVQLLNMNECKRSNFLKKYAFLGKKSQFSSSEQRCPSDDIPYARALMNSSHENLVLSFLYITNASYFPFTLIKLT